MQSMLSGCHDGLTGFHKPVPSDYDVILDRKMSSKITVLALEGELPLKTIHCSVDFSFFRSFLKVNTKILCSTK